MPAVMASTRGAITLPVDQHTTPALGNLHTARFLKPFAFATHHLTALRPVVTGRGYWRFRYPGLTGALLSNRTATVLAAG